MIQNSCGGFRFVAHRSFSWNAGQCPLPMSTSKTCATCLTQDILVTTSLVWSGHLIVTLWSGFLLSPQIFPCTIFPNSEKTRCNFPTSFYIYWSNNESALLSTLVKTLSAKKTLTLYKSKPATDNLRCFFAAPRQHEKRKGLQHWGKEMTKGQGRQSKGLDWTRPPTCGCGRW